MNILIAVIIFAIIIGVGVFIYLKSKKDDKKKVNKDTCADGSCAKPVDPCADGSCAKPVDPCADGSCDFSITLTPTNMAVSPDGKKIVPTAFCYYTKYITATIIGTPTTPSSIKWFVKKDGVSNVVVENTGVLERQYIKSSTVVWVEITINGTTKKSQEVSIL